jgi:hypothetical protein
MSERQPLQTFITSQICISMWTHRSRKTNLAGEGLGKTRSQSCRGGAWQRIRKRTCRGALVCGEEGRRHQQQQNSYYATVNVPMQLFYTPPSMVVLLLRVFQTRPPSMVVRKTLAEGGGDGKGDGKLEVNIQRQ